MVARCRQRRRCAAGIRITPGHACFRPLAEHRPSRRVL